MNRPSDDLPERLLASDATEFERRVLQAAGQKKPSAASSKRMAKALGVTAALATTATATATATAGATATVVWPWVTASVIGLVVAGAVVGTRVRHHEPAAVSPAVSAPVAPAPAPSVPVQRAVVERPPAVPVAPAQRSRPAPAAGDLRDQVAFIDNAREAIAGTGGSKRALEILRHYQDRYPAGSFRPEATALKVEALMKIGRVAEARALAERFVAENRGSLIARRVAEIAGLATP